jgi:hypothetical protein
MKRSLTLFLSLLANLGLCGWIAWELHPPADPLPQAAPVTVLPPVPEKSLPPEPRVQAATTPVPARIPFHWNQVESTNYLTYIEHLRAIHCPERVIRFLITSELEDLYVQQRQQLLAPWQALVWDEAARALRSPNKWIRQMESIGKEIEKKDNQLKEEKDKLLKVLLANSAVPPTTNSPNPSRAPETLAGYLSEEKQQQIMDLERNYSKRANEIRQANRGKPDSELRAQLDEVTRQKRAEIQTLLTPEEYDEYRLRTSSAASLRYQVYGFETTPEEFRELVRKKMEFDEAHPAPQGDSAVARAQREEWQKTRAQLDAQYTSVLGADRFAAFQRAQEGDYQDILRVVERCELLPATAVQVFDIKRAAEASVQQLRQKANLSQEQRGVAFEAIRRETEQAVRQAMGDRGFQTYLRYRGEWLSRMAQPSAGFTISK